MFHSISSSGIYIGKHFNIEVTHMDSAEYPYPANKYTVFDITIRHKDKSKWVDFQDFDFYLLCEHRMYNCINLSNNEELISFTDWYKSAYSDNESCTQSMPLLFEPIHEIHYKSARMISYYNPDNQLISISLTY